MRALSIPFLALALAAVATAQPGTSRSIDGDFGPATMLIEYQDGDDLFLRSTLSLSLNSEKPIPQGAIRRIAVLSKDGRWITLDSFLSSGHTTGIQAKALLPAPDAISMILIQPRRGPWQGWNIEQGSAYTEMEWTYYDGAGNHVRSGPCAPRACFADVTDAFDASQVSTANFKVEINGFSFGVERE